MELESEYIELNHTTLNIDKVLELVKDRFNDNLLRQDMHEVHKGTRSVIARFNTDEESMDYPILQELLPLLEPLLVIIQKELKLNKLGFEKLMIAELPPLVHSTRHVDRQPIMSRIHRVHWCLQTNPEVEFYIGSKIVPFKVGSIIDISNQGYGGHGVDNLGNSDRLHLIIDCFDTAL